MLLTKECDYGIRIIRALASGEWITVKTVSGQEHVPQQYSYKILKKLDKAGFVSSRQGPNGGYRLVKPLHTFTLFDVIMAVNEELFVFDCTRVGSTCPQNDSRQPCAVHKELCRLQNLMLAELCDKTMEALLA